MNLHLMARLFACLLLVLLPAAGACTAEKELAGRVTWIHDGDTLEVNGLGRVRLLGIDCPEMRDSSRDRFYRDKFGINTRALRRAARHALEYNIEEVKGRMVTLRFDGQRRDRHGRLLAYAMLPDGRCLNRLLLEQGLAAVYRKFDFSRKSDFLATEQEARRAGRGMWRSPASTGRTQDSFFTLGSVINRTPRSHTASIASRSTTAGNVKTR